MIIIDHDSTFTIGTSRWGRMVGTGFLSCLPRYRLVKRVRNEAFEQNAWLDTSSDPNNLISANLSKHLLSTSQEFSCCKLKYQACASKRLKHESRYATASD